MPGRPVLVAWGLLLVVLLWTYWPAFLRLVRAWCQQENYSHGYFVPPFAGFLLWLRQGMVDPWPRRGTWWGISLLAAWAVMRWVNFYFNYERDADTLFFLFGGMALFLGGWRALRWSWPSILFLEFMMPLPARVSVWLAQPLQRVATSCTVYILQTLGIPALAKGNVIHLSDPSNTLEVARACSGLSMLTLFIAICVGAVFVIEARPWEKAVILLSAIPIAVLSNIARITLNGMFSEWVSHQAGEWVHHYLGFIMMPLAIVLLWGEMALVSRLIVPVQTQGPVPLDEGAAPRAGGRHAAAALLPGPQRQPVEP
ncbi:MAG: exosortase/archaeosortase family protein [Thermoguttaceae bacterium]